MQLTLPGSFNSLLRYKTKSCSNYGRKIPHKGRIEKSMESTRLNSRWLIKKFILQLFHLMT